MGGPIVRTGTTPAFWNNWEKAFGKKTKSASAKSEAKQTKGSAKKTKSAAAGKKTKGKKK
jgi:hypothetical protein